METSKEDPLPEGWIKGLSKSMQGKVYYFNTETGVSLWEHPSQYAAEKRPKGNHKATAMPKSTVITNEKPVNGTSFASVTPDKKHELNSRYNRIDSLHRGMENVISDVRKVEGNRAAAQEQQKSKDHIGIKRKITQGSFSDNLPSRDSNKDIGCFPSEVKILNKTRSAKLAELLKAKSQSNNSQTKAAKDTDAAKLVKDREKNKNFVTSNDKKIPIKLSKSLKKKINGPTVTKMINVPVQSPVCNLPRRSAHTSSKNSKKHGVSSKSTSTAAKVESQHGYSSIGLPHDKKLASQQHSFKDSCTSSDGDLQRLKGPSKLFVRSSPIWSSSEVSDMNSYSSDAAESNISADMHCEAMEVDDVEFMERTIFKEIQDVRMEKIHIPKPVDTTTTEKPVSTQDEKLFIVLDTNIMLSHLKFVSELKDSPIPGAGRPVIVVPWMVMQELDRLKDAPDTRIHESNEENELTGMGVNVLARKAISFLHSCFSQNHPRLRGQTVVEASQSIPGLVEETNDDSILSCCLLYKNKAANGLAVLLSNDRNLCNKAIVNDVKAFTKKNLVNGLRDLFQSGSIVVHKDHFKEYFVEAGVQEALAQRRKEVDDIVCELQCILREAFAAAIQKEMIEVYDIIWLEIVKIKPPWTLMDTLELLEKHWIAVFGQIVNRNYRESVAKLRKKLSSGDDAPKDLVYASELIDLGFSLCNVLSNHSDYNGVMPKCLAAVIVLQRKCKELTSNASPALIKPQQQLDGSSYSVPNPPQPNLSDKPHQISESITSVRHNETSTNDEGSIMEANHVPHLAVMSTFDEIWKTVTSLSSSIFDALEYPNPFRDANGIPASKPSKEEALNVLHTFVQCLSELVRSIQSVLACAPESSVNDINMYSNLGSSVEFFTRTMMNRDCNITLEQLRSFCLDNFSRTALIQGLSQLDRALAMLLHCLKCSRR